MLSKYNKKMQKKAPKSMMSIISVTTTCFLNNAKNAGQMKAIFQYFFYFSLF